MTVYLYSLPALLSLIAKAVILIFSLRSKIRNLQTKVFIAALLFSILLSINELAVLQHTNQAVLHYAGFGYYAVCVPMIALFVQLAISISIDHWHSRKMIVFYVLFYGYVVSLDMLILFTPWVITGIEEFNGYSGIGIQGPLYFLFELFVVPSFLAMVILPIWGLKKGTDPIQRNQRKLWLMVAAPLSLLITFVMILLHYEIHWFNATVTAPLFFASLMAAMGYSIHSRRPVELDYFLPWSKTRRRKTQLYDNLQVLSKQISEVKTMQPLVDNLAQTFQCSAVIVTRRALIASTVNGNSLKQFPRELLEDVRQLTVKREVIQMGSELSTNMDRCGVAAIVPFYPYNHSASTWILLSEPFGHIIYSKRDFHVIEQLFDRIAILLLDSLLASGRHLQKTRQEVELLEQRHQETKEKLGRLLSEQPSAPTHLHKPLAEHLMELEAKIIEQTLIGCNGNQAQAARLLGVKPNTLHYKLKQYSSSKKQKERERRRSNGV